MVFEAPQVIVGGDGEWCVPCDDVAEEGDDVAIESGPVGLGEGEFLNSPEDSDVASWLFDDDEESRPILSR